MGEFDSRQEASSPTQLYKLMVSYETNRKADAPEQKHHEVHQQFSSPDKSVSQEPEDPKIKQVEQQGWSPLSVHELSDDESSDTYFISDDDDSIVMDSIARAASAESIVGCCKISSEDGLRGLAFLVGGK